MFEKSVWYARPTTFLIKNIFVRFSVLVTVVSGLTTCVLFENVLFPYFLDITRLHFFSGFSGLSLRFQVGFMTDKLFSFMCGFLLCINQRLLRRFIMVNWCKWES